MLLINEFCSFNKNTKKRLNRQVHCYQREEATALKYCEKCKKQQKTGSFCTSCGDPLVVLDKNEPKKVIKTNDKVTKDFKTKKPTTIGSNSKNRKSRFRKLKFALSFLLLFFIITSFVMIYYLNFSKIDQRVKSKFDQSTNYFDQIIDQNIDEHNFDVTIPTELLNGLIDEYQDDLSLELPWGIDVSRIYYDPDRRDIIADLRGFLVNTSVLCDIDTEIDKGKITLQTTNHRLGNLEIPIPQFITQHLIAKLNRVSFKQVNSLALDKLKLTKDGLEVKGKFDINYIQSLIDAITESEHVSLINYIDTHSDIVLPAANMVSKYIQTQEINISETVSKVAYNLTDLHNWMIIDVNVGEKILKDINHFLVDDNKYDIDKLKEQALQKRAQLLTDQEKYNSQYKLEELKRDAHQIYEAIKQYHVQSGVPGYIIASNGRVYSQTLQSYIDLDKLKQLGYLDEDYQYNLYAYQDSIIIGSENNGEFAYLEYSDNYIVGEVKTIASEEALRESINYVAQDQKQPQLLMRSNEDRKNIATVVSEHDNSDNSIFIRYLASDGDYAFIICSNGNTSQQINLHLLQKQGFSWRIIKSFNQSDNIRKAFNEINKNQSINVRLLPPYELKDFQVYNIAESDVREIAHKLYNNGVFTSTETNYVSRVDNNMIISNMEAEKVFLLFDSDDKNSINDYYIIDTDMRELFYFIQAHSDYSNYKPTFLLYQD